VGKKEASQRVQRERGRAHAEGGGGFEKGARKTKRSELKNKNTDNAFWKKRHRNKSASGRGRNRFINQEGTAQKGGDGGFRRGFRKKKCLFNTIFR